MSYDFKTFFADTVCIVTGAANGIGLQTAQTLAQLGATVVGWDIQFEQSDLQQALILAVDKKEFIKLKVDVGNLVAVRNNIQLIEAHVGAIEYLVHAAAILRVGKLDAMNEEDWAQTFYVNTFGTFNVCTACSRAMKSRRRGSIVVVGSNASSTPRMNMGAYCSSKAASAQMVKVLGLELAEDGIRCNVIAPGSTDTDMQRQLWASPTAIDPNAANNGDHVIGGDLAQFRTGIPLLRIATPEDITHGILFFLSPLARHITMQTLVIDGGATF